MRSNAGLRYCAVAVVVAACGTPERGSAPAERAAPGEEPLETATLGDEEVVPLSPEKTIPAAAGRPCAWARAWREEAEPNPLLAGVGGVPTPARLGGAGLSLPVRDPTPRGEIVVEVVVGPQGTVSEAEVVRATDPPWPEAEERILSAVRNWRYERPTMGGTPIAVCTTVVIRP